MLIPQHCTKAAGQRTCPYCPAQPSTAWLLHMLQSTQGQWAVSQEWHLSVPGICHEGPVSTVGSQCLESTNRHWCTGWVTRVSWPQIIACQTLAHETLVQLVICLSTISLCTSDISHRDTPRVVLFLFQFFVPLVCCPIFTCCTQQLGYGNAQCEHMCCIQRDIQTLLCIPHTSARHYYPCSPCSSLPDSGALVRWHRVTLFTLSGQRVSQ